MTKSNLFRLLRGYLWMLLGCIIYALSFAWCYAPSGIAFGGITGVAQIIHHFIPAAPVGVSVIVLNVPLFLLGWKLLGGGTLISSLYAMFLSSVFTDLFCLYDWPPMDEPLMACIFGGVLMGLSLGIVFLQGATTGGTDLIARLLKLKLRWLPMGKLLMAVDLAVILMVAAAFRTLNTALYGIVALYISTLVMDKVLYGLDQSKVAYIVTSNPRPMAAEIDRQLERGATFLYGEGSFTGQNKLVLMCAFKQRQIVPLKALVHQMAPDAFLIVCDAHEVLGQGFRRYQKDDI